jgi:hypothetical protein
MTIIDAKADTGELQAAVTNFGSDHMQRLLELKGEVSSKLSEMSSMMQENLQKKVNYEDFRHVIE